MFFENLFKSDSVKNAAFGMVKKMMAEQKIKYLVIELKDDGELDMQSYLAEQKPVVMGQENIKAIQHAADELTDKIEYLEKANDRLIQVGIEQESAILALTKENNALLEAHDSHEVAAAMVRTIGIVAEEPEPGPPSDTGYSLLHPELNDDGTINTEGR